MRFKLIVLFKTRTVGKPDTALTVGKSNTTLIFFYNIILDEQAAHGGRREQGARKIADYGRLKALLSIPWLVAAGLWSAIVPTNAHVNVTQYHNHSSRDGLYIDSAFTQPLPRTWRGSWTLRQMIVGNVYAQPLYIEGGPGGPMIIAVTESNNVYALDAVDGRIIWQRNGRSALR
jgi:hypothetical protein